MRTLTVRLNSGNQIEVRCGTESRCGECHYLDSGFTPGPVLPDGTAPAEPTRQQLNSALTSLLREWHRVLQTLEDGGLIWLPFDFSDEITQWLAVQRTGDEAALVFGRAPVEGWAINPGNLGDLPRSLSDFVPDEPLVVEVCQFATLLHAIAAGPLEPGH
ncbi:MAG: hypothetical protein ACKO2P_01110 [Planctomycetota bacterium]